ncbi:hypothetical protein RJT34_26631 [Clitoria ternatea]|uniref:Uncharacterized protein n=1 Tax=Clitoria ternatea TaxID=43366 RepID=A0AAN9I992_CLITE
MSTVRGRKNKKKDEANVSMGWQKKRELAQKEEEELRKDIEDLKTLVDNIETMDDGKLKEYIETLPSPSEDLKAPKIKKSKNKVRFSLIF